LALKVAEQEQAQVQLRPSGQAREPAQTQAAVEEEEQRLVVVQVLMVQCRTRDLTWTLGYLHAAAV